MHRCTLGPRAMPAATERTIAQRRSTPPHAIHRRMLCSATPSPASSPAESHDRPPCTGASTSHTHTTTDHTAAFDLAVTAFITPSVVPVRVRGYACCPLAQPGTDPGAILSLSSGDGVGLPRVEGDVVHGSLVVVRCA